MKEENKKEVENLRKIFNESKFKPIKSPIKKFWTMKDGKEISYKQFMEKWKEGMRGITPLQQTNMQLKSTYIILFGIACGFIITLFNLKNLWWLSIILGAGFFNTSISALGLWQKKDSLKNFLNIPINFDDVFKKLNNIEKEDKINGIR